MALRHLLIYIVAAIFFFGINLDPEDDVAEWPPPRGGCADARAGVGEIVGS